MDPIYQIDNSNLFHFILSNMHKDYYKSRYGERDEISLPRTHRTYFDAHCSEFSVYPGKEKLLDLGFVITHGFDIKKAVRDILANHPHVSDISIQRAVQILTVEANHTEYVLSRGNSLDTDIDMLVEDLMRIYRLPLNGSIPHYLEDDFRHVSDMDVYACNGWEIAAEEVNQYQMYKDDNFVEYPGDQTLIQKYHQKDIDSGEIGQIFPAGPCPEPWYGNPMIAKIIILGSMPVYDDFINRCSNVVLGFEPRLAEEVQCMVRRWMCLSGHGFYDHTDFWQSGISHCDAYNSQTYRHWYAELRQLAWDINISEATLMDNVCVINANANYAEYGSDPLAAGLLPSQYYLRILVNYLVNNRSERPLFIIPSASLHKVWKKVLGYWIENEVMLTPDKILINNPNPKLKLTAELLGKRNVKNILEKLK